MARGFLNASGWWPDFGFNGFLITLGGSVILP
jgi:hypothetical protein